MNATGRASLVLLFPLFFFLTLASLESDVEVRRGRRGEEQHSPYHFGEESFQHWTRSQHGHFKVLEKFSKRSELLKGIENYRFAVLEAKPRSFMMPSHFDADEVFYVMQGEGTITLLWKDKRESHCIKEGDVMMIPSGAIVYSVNTHDTEKLRIAMLLNPISTPGCFEEFFPVGGENPETFFKTFSDEVLEAAFNTRRERLERVFGQQRRGEIIRASEEQIRALSKSCSRGGGSPSEKAIKPFSLVKKKPCYSNNHGKLYEVTPDECPHLQKLDMEVGLANITRGSMMAPSYSSRATKIAIVVQGSGYFEMACPHLSGQSERREWEREQEHRRGREWGRGEGEEEEEQEQEQKRTSYKLVKSRIQEGSVIVIPAGHPVTVVAGNDDNLQLVCFGIHATCNEKIFLAGKNNVLKQMENEAKELSFGTSAREVDQVIDAQSDAVFLRGPERRGGGGVSM